MFQNAAQRVHEDLSNLSEYNHGLVFEMKRMQWLSREALAKEVRSRVHATALLAMVARQTVQHRQLGQGRTGT